MDLSMSLNNYCGNNDTPTSKRNAELRKNMNKNIQLYVRYLKSSLVNSEDTFNTTYSTYLSKMKLFLKYLSEYEDGLLLTSKELQERFSEIWENYCEYCFSRGNSKITIQGKRVAVSSFFDWCVRRRYIEYNPFIYVDKMKLSEKDKRRKSYFLTPQQIWEIKYVMKTSPKKFDIQDRLLFNLFIDSGCRISEIYSITLDQLDMEEMVFNGVRHKEGYIEPVIFFEETRDLLHEWLLFRSKNKINSNNLFITNYNKKYNKMSKEAIRGRVRKMGKIVGINDFYPHSIRKSILNITGKQSQDVATALGHHKSSSVTVKYYMEKKKLSEMRSTLAHIREISGL